jgi:glycosyltransferase involved in cell wall biosynthesis
MAIPGNKKVGILIPTYRRLAFLRQALQSALRQSHENLRIMVIDNDGRDGTSEYLRSISDDRVVYLLNENNIGMIGSINRGIRLMDEDIEWCTVLSDDDLLDEHYIRASLDAVERQTARAIVNGNRVLINVRGEKIRNARAVSKEQDAFKYLESRLQRRTETYLTGILFHRGLFEEIGGYPSFSTGVASDDAFIFSMSLKDRLVHGREARAFIRFHEGAESRALSDLLKILDTISQFRHHCYRAAEGCSHWNEEAMVRFRGVLGKYEKALNSGCWLKHLHDVLFPVPGKTLSGEAIGEKIADLCSIVEGKKFRFTSRVKFDCICFRKLRLCPEASMAYRLFWDFMTNFSLLDHVLLYFRGR